MHCNMARHALRNCAERPYWRGAAGREYRSMMVLMPSWHTEQKVSLRSNMMHCISGR